MRATGGAVGGGEETDGHGRRRLLVTHPAWGISFVARAGALMCCSALLAMAAGSGQWLWSVVVIVVILLIAACFHLLVVRRWRSWRPAFTHAAIVTGEVNLLLVVLLSPGVVLPYVSVAAFTWVAAFAGLYLSRRVVATHVLVMNAVAGAALSLTSDTTSVWMALALLVPCTSGLAVLTYRLAGEMRRQTEQDPLTGLPNRRGLASRSQDRRRSAARSVVALDLDRFKQVNDAFGHEAGDRLLVEVATRWCEVLDVLDVLARTGGDEFVILHAAGPESAVALVEALRRVTPDAVGVTAGIARRGDHEPFERCLVAADASLYEAKNLQRGTTVVHGGEEQGAPAQADR